MKYSEILLIFCAVFLFGCSTVNTPISLEELERRGIEGESDKEPSLTEYRLAVKAFLSPDGHLDNYEILKINGLDPQEYENDEFVHYLFDHAKKELVNLVKDKPELWGQTFEPHLIILVKKIAKMLTRSPAPASGG